MSFWLAVLLLIVSAAGIILSAAKISKKPIKILGIVLSSIIFALMLIYIILVLIFVFRADDPDTDSQFIAQTENMTDNGDGTFTYDDGEISLTFEKISPDIVEEETALVPSVINGESGGREWKAVTDKDGKPQIVYVTIGDTAVAAKVNSSPDDAGAEYAASAAAVLVKDSSPYSDDTDGTESSGKYRTDSASFFIEEANCLLYYPAQLTAFSEKNGKYTFRDEKSSAALKVTLSPNEYTSMSEVEGFIKNSENSLVLAYGSNWFTSEIREKSSVTFMYSGLGSKYIVEAELTYPEKDKAVFDKLQKLIKCCFVGEGVWKSSARGEGYSKDSTAVYSDKFSRELAAYYSEKYGVILLYPEIFSDVDKTDEFVFFTDPVTGAEINLFSDPDRISLSDWPQTYGFDESYIDGEHRVKASDMSGGRYGVMYLTDSENVCAVLSYPEEYAWVYEGFESDLTLTASSAEVRNTEMQTVFIEEYGALITMPLQFVQTSFYDGIIRYKDGLNGMEMTVSFKPLGSDKERKNLFACFDVVADDEDIFVGDSYIRWLSNSGFFYGARGSDMKALMQIDAPNAEKAYESTLPLFSVEFVTTDSKEVTKAQQLAQKTADVKDMSDPPEEAETTTSAKISHPNKKLVYDPESDYTYASADGEYWYSFKQDFIEENGEFAIDPDSYAYGKHKELITHILDILRYNNYDVDQLAWEYCKTRGYSSYYEPSMLTELTVDMELAMQNAYQVKNPKDSDLGKGVPSVLEEICRILDIEKPDYVRDLPEDTAGTTAKTEAVTSSESEGTAPGTSSSESPDRYRINSDTSHDAQYGYNSKMADTIDKILAKYDETDIAAYISETYSDETLAAITEEMYMGGYDYDYGYTTTLVYILSTYPDDAVVSAMANGRSLPGEQAFLYFPAYNDYGTGWGEPDTYGEPVWRIANRGELDEYDLLTDTALCGDIYDLYGNVLLCLTGSSMHGQNVPFWINGWEKAPEKAAYCRDFIVPKAINFIDEYCSEDDEFTMDCLSADAQTASFSAGGKNRTGIRFTAHSLVYNGDSPTFDTMEFYLDIKTGALYRVSTSGKAVTVTDSILG